MAFGEAFTILAVLEATDRMSRVLERVDGSLDAFSQTATRTATVAAEAGARIDESLLQTASGADAVELADAKMAAASARVAAATQEQAAAERALIDAQAQLAASADGDAEAAARFAAAADALTAAQKRTALATKEATAAEDHQAAVVRATAAATTQAAAVTDSAAASTTRLGGASAAAAAHGSAASKALGLAGLAVAAVGYESVKSAGNFESATEHLVTDAGESQKNIGYIRAEMLKLSTDTGTASDEMTNGMYHIESAGFHGKAAVDELTTAAEGAKVGGADLDTIAKALTGTMNAFGESGGTSTQMMNQMIATVAAGDVRMQDLGSSLGNVAAIAGAAGLKYAEVGGAIATMTAQNMTAQRATQDLAHTISSLQNPNNVQIKQMQALGLNSNSLSKDLGKIGLTGTLDVLTKAVAAHTKGGDVLISTFNASKQAAANANTMIKAMPPNLQKLAQGFLAGTTSAAQWKLDLKALPPIQQHMMQQFGTLADKTHEFNSLLSSGSPAAQTYNAAMSKLLGGTTGLNTALMLSGGHAATFRANVESISEAAKKTGHTVEDWDKIQGTFNQKMERAKASVEAAGIALGTTLLPVVSKVAGAVAGALGPVATFIAQHQKLVGLLLSVIGPALVVVGIIKTITIITKAWAAAQLMLDAAMDDNPIGLIVIAIAALVGGLIYAYNHFKTFRDIVNSVFSVVKTIVMTYIHLIILELKLLADAAVWVWHALETAWHAIAGAAMAVWHALVSVWNAIVDTTTTVWNSIIGFFAKWWPLLLAIFLPPVAILIALWNHFHQDLFDAAKTVWNAISSFFVGVWHLIVSAAEGAWKLFKKYVIAPIEEVWAYLQPAIHKIESFLSSIWNIIKSVVQTDWRLIKTYIITPVEEVWSKISEIFGKVKTAISTQLTAAWNAVKNIGSKFMSIGKAIVDGIIKGVTGAGSSLFGSLKNLANGALSAAKSFLGIGSPSKEFASQVGQWIPHGIAQGVIRYASVAHKAVQDLSGSLTGTAHTSVTGGTALAGGLGAALGGRSGAGDVIVHVHLEHATVTGDRDIDQLVQKIGAAVAKKILPQGGVRVAF